MNTCPLFGLDNPSQITSNGSTPATCSAAGLWPAPEDQESVHGYYLCTFQPHQQRTLGCQAWLSSPLGRAPALFCNATQWEAAALLCRLSPTEVASFPTPHPHRPAPRPLPPTHHSPARLADCPRCWLPRPSLFSNHFNTKPFSTHSSPYRKWLLPSIPKTHFLFPFQFHCCTSFNPQSLSVQRVPVTPPDCPSPLFACACARALHLSTYVPVTCFTIQSTASPGSSRTLALPAPHSVR